MRRVMAVSAAAAMLLVSTAAQADAVSGWKNWADHADKVMAAVKTGSQPAIDAACIGTTKTIISQGFQFPYWGQMLPQFCGRVQAENQKREITLRGWMQECKQLRQVRGALEKSKPVDTEPRAKPLADDMVAYLEALDTRECSHPPRR